MFNISNLTSQKFSTRIGDSRVRLTGPTTYYIRTDGNDSNDGSADTPSSAFASIQRAVILILQAIDTAGYDVTIKLADGTYTSGGAYIYTSTYGGGAIYIVGNTTTPSNVVISTQYDAITTTRNTGIVIVTGVKIQTTAGNCLVASNFSNLIFQNVVFGSAPGNSHVYSLCHSNIWGTENYTISGGAGIHVNSAYRSTVNIASGKTITLTGTPSFTTRFLHLQDHAYANFHTTTFSGTATGQRYMLYRNSGVLTGLGNGNVNYFPGSSAGANLYGSQYA